MKRIPLILLALPNLAFGLCPSNLQVDVTDSSLRVRVQTDVVGRSTALRLRYGATVAMDLGSAPKAAVDEKISTRYLNVTDLLPGLPKLYFDPQVSDPARAAWSDYASCQAQLCPSAGDQPGGYACEPDGKGALIPYVRVPEDVGHLEAPIPPRHARANPRERPVINGSVTKLKDCSAVQQALDDHGTGGTKDPNLNHEIRLPPGAICRPEQESSPAGKNLPAYVLPLKRGPGTTVITCDWGPQEGPPAGVQYAPRLRTVRSCGFSLNRRTVAHGSAFEANGGLFLAQGCNDPPCTEGWRFETLVVEAGDWREFSPRKVAITSVDLQTARMTTAEPVDDLYATHAEMVLNLPGVRTMVMGNGAKPHHDFAQRGCMTVKYSSNEIGCYGPAEMTGKYEGGGFVSAAQGYEIQSCRAEKGTVACTLAQDHGLGDFYSFPIKSLRGGAIEVDAMAHGWTNTAAVLIEGNSACDGVYVLESTPGPASAKLARTGCSGTGGVVRRLYTGRFFDLEGAGAGALEGVRLVDFPAPNVVRAFQADAGAAAIDSGGFVYTNPKITSFFLLRDVARITWDRTLFQLGAPFRARGLISLINLKKPEIPCDCALLDSHVEGLHFWQPVTPGRGVVDSAQTFPVFSAIPVVLHDNWANDLHIDGVTIRNSAAFAFFADQAGQPGPQDVTFRNISMALPQELIGGTHSKGLAYNLRHFIEVKGGARLAFENLEVQNWPAVGISSASPIFFSYGGNDPSRDRLMQDVSLRNVFMRNVAVGVAFRSGNTHGFAAHQPIRRVLIDNLLIDGIDYPNMQSAPHHQSLGAYGTFYGEPVGAGSALAFGGPAEDVRITRVTARRVRSKRVPNFLWMMDGRVNNFQVDRSIVSFSPAQAEPNAVSVYGHTTGQLDPPVGGGGAEAFFGWTERMGQPDPRSWFGTPSAPVGVIPCLPGSETQRPDFQARNNVKSLAERAFACSGKSCGNWNVLIAGKDRQSCAEREAGVLDQDIQGIGPFAGLGADTAELAKALGYFPAQVMEIGPNSGKLVYRPLREEPCTVDHSRDPDFATFIRGRDLGGAGDRAMLLGGYKPGETAYYRLLCPQSVQIGGKFQTKSE